MKSSRSIYRSAPVVPNVKGHRRRRRPVQRLDTYGGPLLGSPTVGLLALGKQPHEEEATSGNSTPSRTSVMVASTCTLAPWSLGILNQDGEIVLHRKRQAAPEPFLKALAPYRADLVVCVEGMFTWYWRADLCAREGLPFVLGHALYMKAIHGGKATHDTIDAPTIAVLLRGGMLPQAYVSPAEMRATRDLLRRRGHLMRKRAELLTHVQQTNRQDNLPDIGQKIASTANRDGVAERGPDPAVQQSIDVDLALIGHYDHLRRDVERSVLTTATQHHANTRSRLRTVPGSGAILSLVLLDEIHDIERFPRGQEFVSDGRLVKCAKESAGKRSGTAGTKIGHASLTWAFSEAAVLFLRTNPAGQKYLARRENKHGKGKALTVLAHQLARAVYDMLKRGVACALNAVLQRYGRGVGEPAASRGHDGLAWQPCAASIHPVRRRTPMST